MDNRMTDTPTIQGFTECSHGWRGHHCIRDNEGSCPFEYDRDNPAADCRCKESQYLEIPIKSQVTDEMIERAVAAHTKAEGFISPFDDAYVSMRAALEAALEVPDD